MIDVKLELDSNGQFDLVLENGDIASVNSLDTAIWVSLFTDARASASQVVIPEHRRGWMGNIASPVNNRQLGGLLWLVDQRRLNQATLNEAIDYAQKALNWITDDAIANTVEVSGEIIPTYGIQLTIMITAISGSTDTRYINLWELTGAY